jgi:hypothetical protein
VPVLVEATAHPAHETPKLPFGDGHRKCRAALVFYFGQCPDSTQAGGASTGTGTAHLVSGNRWQSGATASPRAESACGRGAVRPCQWLLLVRPRAAGRRRLMAGRCRRMPALAGAAWSPGPDMQLVRPYRCAVGVSTSRSAMGPTSESVASFKAHRHIQVADARARDPPRVRLCPLGGGIAARPQVAKDRTQWLAFVAHFRLCVQE